MNGTRGGTRPYALPFVTSKVDVLNALLACGADPSLQDVHRVTPLMAHCLVLDKPDLVAGLLQDTRVKATVNVRSSQYGG